MFDSSFVPSFQRIIVIKVVGRAVAALRCPHCVADCLGHIAFAFATASFSEQPRAKYAAIADELVQPVPCVLVDAIRACVKV